jgi:hypothetical protein
MKNQFTISSAYQWNSTNSNDINVSELAIKTITEYIIKRFSIKENKKFNYKINYRRLRASAGKNMLESIIKRIEYSNVVIIDISSSNSNVFIEAGISIAISKFHKNLSIYFIRQRTSNNILPQGIPSDLQGYFISEYELDQNSKIVFKDKSNFAITTSLEQKMPTKYYVLNKTNQWQY